MPKEENFNPVAQNPEVGPVLPTVDPSVLAVPEPTAVPETNPETTTTVAEETTQANTETVKPAKTVTDKKSRKNKDKKPKATKAEKANEEQKVVTVNKPYQVKPVHEVKLGRTRSNPFITVLVVISLIMSCVSLTYCIWDFIRSDVMAIIDHFNNSAVEEPAPEKTPTTTPETISITLDDTVYHGVAIIDQDPTSGVTLLKFQNVDNLPFTSEQQVVVINKPTAGDTIQLTILRDGKERTVNIILGSDKN